MEYTAFSIIHTSSATASASAPPLPPSPIKMERIGVFKDDISKIAKIVELSGYKFQDDRFPNLEKFQEIQIIILVILNIIVKLKLLFLFCHSYAS